jgi:pimeloyl-ACP methyl ester carboxylesterase
MPALEPNRSGHAVNGTCRIYFETFGSSDDPTLLLVNGLGSQCINFDERWCAMFVDEGLHVVRFDNRDVGLSTHFTDAATDERGAAYQFTDMAADAISVLDELGIERTHVMGLSMGGMIVQHLAIDHGDRLLSMTSVMSHTGEADYGSSTPEALAQLIEPAPPGLDGAIANSLAGRAIWGSPDHLDDEQIRATATRAFERANDPAGVARQYRAVTTSPRWAARLPEVTTPSLVIHGTADTLIEISGGRRTAELIPGARFVAFEGMGHDYPPAFWRQWVDEVAGFIRSVDTS